jgi:CBS domain-containing protein
VIVKDVMRSNFVCISSQSTLRAAAEKMIHERVETFFVIENDQLVGVIGIRDLFTLPVPASYGRPMRSRQDEEALVRRWGTTPIVQLMNTQIISVTEECPLMSAAEMMVNKGKHPLAVLRGNHLVGTIDRTDIIRALLESGNTTQEGKNT